jgi:hypothetical protein
MIDPNNLLNNTLANRAEYMSGLNELQPGLGQLNTGEANLYDER